MANVYYRLDRNEYYDDDGFMTRIEWHLGKVEFFDRNGTKRVFLPTGDRYSMLNDQFHRLDGPAVQYTNGSKHWFISGVEYTEEHFRVLVFALHKQEQNF